MLKVFGWLATATMAAAIVIFVTGPLTIDRREGESPLRYGRGGRAALTA